MEHRRLCLEPNKTVSKAHCQTEATNEMATELPLEEQVDGEDSTGELLKSLYRTRKAAHNGENKWQIVIIGSCSLIGTWSPEIMCCRKRELCGVCTRGRLHYHG